MSAGRAAWYRATERPRVRRIHALDLYRIRGQPLISILLPTHNRLDVLRRRAFASVMAQDYPWFELIIACHGCDDGTFDYFHNLGVPRIRVIDVARRETYPPTARNHWLAGPVAPLNAAIAVAEGQWLARIDDDDSWTTDHLSVLLAYARAGRYDFVSSAYWREVDGRREVVEHDHGYPPIGGTQTWLWRREFNFMRWNPDCWRKEWNAVNDTDLAQRFRDAKLRIGWCPEPTAYIIPRPGERAIGLKAYLNDEGATERRMSFKQ